MSKEAKETETLEDAACKYFQFSKLDIEPGTPDWYRAEGINFASAWQSQHPTPNVPLIALNEAAQRLINDEGFTDELDNDILTRFFIAGANYERSKLPEIIKEVLKRAAENAKHDPVPFPPNHPFAGQFRIDKQSILNVDCDDLIK